MFNDVVNGACKHFVENKRMHDTTRRLFEAIKTITKGKIDGFVAPGAVADYLGVGAAVVTNWKTRGVSKEGRLKAHEKTGISPSWIDTGLGDMLGVPVADREPVNVIAVPTPKLVPVLNKVNAGMYKEIVASHPDDIDYIPVYGMPTKRYTFALRVDGDSMEPGFPHGCIVIVDPEAEAKPNDYVIAMNGDNEATFKQLIKDGPDFYLRPRNQRYPIKPLGVARIIGVVCGIQLQAKPGDPTWPV